MGLRFKMFFGFVTLILMLLIAGIWSIYELNAIGSSVPKMLAENYQSINAAKKMSEALEREDSAILLLLLGRWQEGRSILNNADSLFSANFKFASANITLPGEQSHLDTIQTYYTAYKGLWLRPIVGTQKEGSLEWYFQSVHQAFISAKNAVEHLIDLNANRMYQMASALDNRSNRAIMPGIVAILSALVFTLIFNFLVNLYVVGPIIRITKGIKKFKEKQTPFDVTIETRDELYDLSNAIGDLCQYYNSKGTAK
jgi:NtrC-family two-component system sensor histidine kinase KinB